MKAVFSLFFLIFSLAAHASECPVSLLEAHRLKSNLSKATLIWEYHKDSGTENFEKLECKAFRVARLGDKRTIEGFCSHHWQKLNLDYIYFSDTTEMHTLEKALSKNSSCETGSYPDSLNRFQTEYTVENHKREKKIQAQLDLERSNRTCSVLDGPTTTCYVLREEPVIKAALIYYGSFWNEADLLRLKPLLTKNFAIATKSEIDLDVISTHVIPMKHKVPYDFKARGVSDIKQLQRIWYFTKIGRDVAPEIYNEFVKNQSEEELKNLDFIIAVTEPQYSDLGFQSGHIALTEQPRENGWDVGGKTRVVSDHEVADILIHELGHAMGLGHASEQCEVKGLSYEEKQACCENSPAKNDPMSYCRNRQNDREVNIFQECTMDLIKNEIKPRLLSGLDRKIPQNNCK